MPSPDYLRDRFPILGERLARTTLATLPTPVRVQSVSVGSKIRQLSIKYDNLTGRLYGGNKVRVSDAAIANELETLHYLRNSCAISRLRVAKKTSDQFWARRSVINLLCNAFFVDRLIDQCTNFCERWHIGIGLDCISDHTGSRRNLRCPALLNAHGNAPSRRRN